jgi:putative phosphoesterase
MRSAVRGQGPFDALFHLGDGARDGMNISEEFEIPFYGVAGNEDYGVALPERRLVASAGWSFLLFHGHQMEINPYHSEEEWDRHFRDMAGMAAGEDVSFVLFGHSHQAVLKCRDGIVLCNPGNQYRGSSTPPTFAALDLDGGRLEIRVMEEAGEDRWSVLLEGTAAAAALRGGRSHAGRAAAAAFSNR